MEHISKILEKAFSNDAPIIRFKYAPYDIKFAKQVFCELLEKKVLKNLLISKETDLLIENLIKYIHGEDSQFDKCKGLFLTGKTGTGKTTIIETIAEYMKIDDVRYNFKGKILSFIPKNFPSRTIMNDFAMNGFDAIGKYEVINIISIDDLGAEQNIAQHYGNKVNVIEQVIEERYRRGLITHYTSNLPIEAIQERYGDRVHSRIYQTSNIVRMNEIDFRLI